MVGCTGDVGPEGPPGEDGARGPKGDAGEMGEMGEMGEPGSDAYSPAWWVACSVVLDLVGDGGVSGADGVAETVLSYELLRHTNDDLNVSCNGSIGSAVEGSQSRFFPNAVKGANTGGCVANVDYPPLDGNAGAFVFGISDGDLVAIYADPPHAMDGDFYRFVDDDCTVLVADGDGGWDEAELEDVL